MEKVLLCILDGFGHGKDYKGNAITHAKTPFLKELYKNYEWTLLKSSGEDVGIPKGNQGGSEVGHLTIGAGRIVMQSLLEIDTSIKMGSFFKKKELLSAISHVKKNNSALHILGMISDQGVHSDLDHCLALITLAKQHKIKDVYIHAITDGRDVAPFSAEKFIKILQKHIKKEGVGKIATLIGRYYAMDRDKNLDRTEVAYNLYTKGKGDAQKDPLVAIKKAYKEGVESDYYLKPILLNENGIIHKKDAVIFFNFRTDRAAQLTEMFLTKLKPYFVAFGPYTKKAPVVFPEPKVKNNLGSIIAKNNLKQLRIAETEKYAHVTFFFNSQEKEPYKSEDRILVPSPKCASYASKPEMSALKITTELIKRLDKKYDFIALNFANPDLVGHSGDFKATVKAIEVIDECLSKIVPVALKNGYTILITGDHGNAEYKIYEKTGGECPSHTKNPVPFIFLPQNQTSNPKKATKIHLKKSSHKTATGGLKDIAPTILNLLGIKAPKEMTGENLVL